MSSYPPPSGPMDPGMPPPYAPQGMPPPMQPMMPMAPERRITSGAIIAIVGGLLGLIGFFLPWYNISGIGVAAPLSWSGAQFSIFGILPLLFAILAIVGGGVKRPLLAGIVGIIGFIMTMIPFVIIESIVGPSAAAARATCAAAGATCSIGWSFGFFLTLIGMLLAMVGGFVGWRQMK